VGDVKVAPSARPPPTTMNTVLKQPMTMRSDFVSVFEWTALRNQKKPAVTKIAPITIGAR
jgi:hypothetical protein